MPELHSEPPELDLPSWSRRQEDRRQRSLSTQAELAGGLCAVHRDDLTAILRERFGNSLRLRRYWANEPAHLGPEVDTSSCTLDVPRTNKASQCLVHCRPRSMAQEARGRDQGPGLSACELLSDLCHSRTHVRNSSRKSDICNQDWVDWDPRLWRPTRHCGVGELGLQAVRVGTPPSIGLLALLYGILYSIATHLTQGEHHNDDHRTN